MESQILPRQKKITLKDVALESGVSPTTASRVLANTDYPIREEIREKVIETARRLGYPKHLAVSPSESREIAVLVPTVANLFYTSLISGIEGVLLKENYNIIFYNTFMSGSKENMGQILSSVLSKGVQGIVAASSNFYRLLGLRAAELQERGIKVVLADSPSLINDFNSVYYDYKKGARIGTEYLLDKGHRDIVYAGLTTDRESRELRIQGFYKAMESRGRAVSGEQVLIYEGDNLRENQQIEAGEELAQQLLRFKERPTAVFAMNDMVAFGMLRHFRRTGLRVPEEISLLGFDDSAFCETSYPGLTTVKVQSEQMGRMAAMLLLDDIRGIGGMPIRLSVEPCIVERDTVAEAFER